MDVPDHLLLDDPHTIRVMTNPVRLFAVTELYSTQQPRTATELAELQGGISASSMSYHLRELESLGIVRRAPAKNGRERPWLAAARSYTLQTTHGLDDSDRGALLDSYLEPTRARMRSHLARRSRLDPADQDTIFNILSHGELLLTEEQTRALVTELGEIFGRFEAMSWAEAGSTEHRRDESEPIRSVYVWSLVPDNPDDFNRPK